MRNTEYTTLVRIGCNVTVVNPLLASFPITAQKMKFSIQDFFSKCDQIRWKWKTLFFVQCILYTLQRPENQSLRPRFRLKLHSRQFPMFKANDKNIRFSHFRSMFLFHTNSKHQKISEAESGTKTKTEGIMV